MDFKDNIKQLVERVRTVKDNVSTEEATKTALIMPFLHSLGYDIFNPLEVVPEYICDTGTKKGEKIDYAIIKDGEPIILIECKHCSENLDAHSNQLLRYFHVSKAKFGILTNGVVYRFYTDLDKENLMDEKPFLEVDMLNLKDLEIDELRKFHKSYFDIENILNTASDLKYTSALKSLINSELSNPSPEFVKLLAKQVYSGLLIPRVMESFTMLIKRAAILWKNEIIDDRLKAALSNNSINDNQSEAQPINIEAKRDTSAIVTTEEELQAFYIVRSILAKNIEIDRIVYRDAQSYCAILLDDNNRKPLCRLYFNSANKYISTFDAEKKETKQPISSLNDIYLFADQILDTASSYEK